ncbi:ATP-dependent zinc protease family protein [Spartinivicinus poritis]|uniref:RimK/LysX family protein n=1 Tax=Spartinivicinus poritis TaxID=2994640 RepID=A0ABT5UEX0_9GAMM|nr:RimK/LysX family protein [Spartinivicinus sp. A2-2]MDE1464932.1 RimK/LysX family protein [Spartinivicinus sp. A2-2]
METNKVTVGWREWVSLPGLNINTIKAKVDTGAKTCALHAYYIDPYDKDGETWVKFGIHPIQLDTDTSVECHARLADQRYVTDSGGHSEQRFVIITTLVVGREQFDAEITLTNRDSMRFRMLLGRNALNNRFTVDPVESFLLGGPSLDDVDQE